MAAVSARAGMKRRGSFAVRCTSKGRASSGGAERATVWARASSGRARRSGRTRGLRRRKSTLAASIRPQFVPEAGVVGIKESCSEAHPRPASAAAVLFTGAPPPVLTPRAPGTARAAPRAAPRARATACATSCRRRAGPGPATIRLAGAGEALFSRASPSRASFTRRSISGPRTPRSSRGSPWSRVIKRPRAPPSSPAVRQGPQGPGGEGLDGRGVDLGLGREFSQAAGGSSPRAGAIVPVLLYHQGEGGIRTGMVPPSLLRRRSGSPGAEGGLGRPGGSRRSPVGATASPGCADPPTWLWRGGASGPGRSPPAS